MSVFATHDHDGGVISRDAEIVAFDMLEDARKWLLQTYDPRDWITERAQIDAGQWSDCWIKALYAPPYADRVIAPFQSWQIDVQEPGQNPGGRFWWLTPHPDVLIVRRIAERPSAEQESTP